ncbi:uncharacterized protein BBA_04606 [Beauveria bassiana ARSEF 2860]|uniref:Uncharacterized protein n=1 Tax=Beauveria bassiana (strain ARSEF 2860) TaxID=655819 RepID=J5JWD0_BEAB2|nr:uncharacterized protein BBA_04606 [Beauveria bassiana ARSEF 2860]EJP66666.1 hypothetical protein BBA_04606 [Beauveria bassiana ARSEF 2860]
MHEPGPLAENAQILAKKFQSMLSLFPARHGSRLGSCGAGRVDRINKSESSGHAAISGRGQ